MSTHTNEAYDSAGVVAGNHAAARNGNTSLLEVRRDDVSFLSAGQLCDGWLYRPTGPGFHPCVVMAHGLGGVRGAVLPEIAERFAAAGIAALVFDYRHSGTSAGQPRGLVDIGKQREDYRAAVAFARCLRGIDADRIALWGTSFSGGHVLSVAAGDAGIAAAVIQNPYVDGRHTAAAAIRWAGRAGAARLAWKGLLDQVRGLVGREPHRVPLAGVPGTVALMTTSDAVAGYRSILRTNLTGWEPAIPARIVLRMRHDRPVLQAHRVACPLLVCVCEYDAISPASAAVRVADHARRAELRRYPIGHFDIFTSPWLDQVVADQIGFLRRTLLHASDDSRNVGGAMDATP